MKQEKFLKDTLTVLDFIQTYCEDKHEKEPKTKERLELVYKGKKIGECEYDLCVLCKENFLYSYARLKECPHEEKPRCRKCPNPCYEKYKWKEFAKIMRYSGMKKGLLKVKKIFKRS